MSDSGYLRYATISRDTLYFTCEDDIWSAPVKGGIARRLTVGRGECTLPRVSPNGEQVAFSGREEGHAEVFIIPAVGGQPRRLTYAGGDRCIVSGWLAQTNEILYTSDAGTPFYKGNEALAVAPSGGMPRKLNVGYVQTVSVSKKGQTVVGMNNIDPATWKRYRGGTAGDIWIETANKQKLFAGDFRRLIKLDGNLVWPMWLGERIYFLSDHEGVANIYSCSANGSGIKKHTHHKEYFVRYPSTDGRKIAYTAGGEAYVFDPKTNKSSKVNIVVPSSTAQLRRKFVEGKDNLEHFALHPEGHSLALIARGQPLTLAHWEGAAIQHGDGSKVRYRHCEWLSEGKRFVVLSDGEGAESLELHYADRSKKPEKACKGDFGRVVDMAVSPKEDVIAVTNHRYELILIDLAKKKFRVIDKSKYERITGPSWSPDGKWLAYCFAPGFDTQVIKIADTRTDELHTVTNRLRQDTSPCFDPDGNYLYFLSARDFYPVYDSMQFDLSFPKSVRPFLVTLRKDVPSPFRPQPKPMFGQQPKAPSNGLQDGKGQKGKADKKDPKTAELKPSKDDKKKGADSAAPPPPAIQIDFDGIEERILGFPIEEARCGKLACVKGRILYTQYPLKGIRPSQTWMNESDDAGHLYAFDFDEQRSAALQFHVHDFRLGPDNRTVVVRFRDRLRVMDGLEKLASEGQNPSTPAGVNRRGGWVDLSRVSVLVEPQNEWRQIYEESWRLQSEQFWDEKMSDVDWNVVHDRYAKLLPRLRTRAELSDVIWEMQGELGTSHAYEFGGDHRRPPYYNRGFLGAEFAYDSKSDGYRITNILRGDSWDEESDSPLALPGLSVKVGDCIIAVGGRSVSKELGLDELLVNTGGKQVVLTILGQDKKTRSLVVKTLTQERTLRYRNWVESNRKIVHEATKGKIGYVHIPNMGPAGFAEFHRGYLAECNRQGLVVDVRFNGGGHVSPLLLEKLARKRVGYDVSRWGQPYPYPPESVAGPLVAITNQFAGSDGDIFSHCFKLYKLGPLVGKRTWGGVIGIFPRHRLVDGTITTQPEFSFWFTDVGWKVENYGTEPDYEVDFSPQDYRSSRDPQLTKAIELSLDALKQTPVDLPDFTLRPSLALPHMQTPSVKSQSKKKKARAK